MASLNQIYQFSIDLLGESPRRVGSKADSVDLTVGGQVFDTGNVTIADNYGQDILWQSGNGGMDGFDYLLFISNADVWIEISNTTPATDERSLFFVPANALMALPSRNMGGFASTTSRLDGAALVDGTDYGDITEIRVQRDAADLAGDATVRLVLID